MQDFNDIWKTYFLKFNFSFQLIIAMEIIFSNEIIFYSLVKTTDY